MIRLIQRRLIIPRGDTGTFTVPLLATAQTGDVQVFTIFDEKTQKKVFEKVVEVSGDAMEIEFSHADTVNLPVGDYVWDIKFYKDPDIVDGVPMNGTEIDSYYAAFKLPVCEIRQTGDTLLIADDAPTSTIAPDQLNIILAATDEINAAKREVINAAEVVEANTQTASDAATSATADAARAETAAEAASTSASAASQSAADASSAKDSAVAANTAAQQALLDANLAATIATTKATEASTSATAAGNSASAASNSASAASSSASKAATSASNAAASVTEMEALVRAIPTNVSEFENDAGYITAAALPTKISDLTDDSGHYIKPITGIPASDLAETYLTEHQDISMKANSADLATVATSGSYEDLINKPFIPTRVSDLTDDSGHYTKPVGGIPASDLANGVLDVWSGLTYHTSTMSTDSDSFVLGGATDAPTEINKCLVTSTPSANVIPKFDYQGRLHSITPEDEWDGSNAVATTEYVDNMISDNMPEIPTNISELNNDAGYLTSFTETDPTVPSWAKQPTKPTYTATEVGAPTVQEMNSAISTAIGSVNSFDMAVVQALPTQNINTHTIYLVPKTGETNDVYDEYVYINSNWEMVGNTQIDLSNYVQKTDYATNSTYGLVKGNSDKGFYISNAGETWIFGANADLIKAGTEVYKPIVPAMQHRSIFYGLAKAAGDSTQSTSSNAVGTYTDEAKAAIKNMLGITQTLTVTVLTQDNVTVTGQTVYVRANDASGEVYATAAYEGQPVSFSLPTGFQYYVSVSDTLSHHFNPTTARGVIKDANVAVTLTYSDFSTIKTAPDIKAALNAGMDLTDLVGEQITCTKSGETLTWDVVDYDDTNKRITLLLHDAFGTANMLFEPAQALMWCENGLAAGSYTFKWNTTQVYFTLTTAIPAGGQLRATNSSFWTYESQSATATLETGTVSTTEISGATDLGKTGDDLLNHYDRVSYGSNNFAESALYWWLNNDAAANTQRVPVTKFSRAHSYAQPGFLNGLDASFVAVLDNTTWLCACNNVYECPESLGGYTKGKGRTYTVTSKIGLASEMEIFGSYGGNQDGSTIYDLYNGAEATDCIKYRGTSAQVWWLRSPNWGIASSERIVGSSGSAIGNYANVSYSVVPACRISVDPSGN